MKESIIAVRRILKAEFVYEERITLWKKDSFEEAIEASRVDSLEYAEDLQLRDCGLAQAYRMQQDELDFSDSKIDGLELFSWIRESNLELDEYVNRYFDTGTEIHGQHPDFGPMIQFRHTTDKRE